MATKRKRFLVSYSNEELERLDAQCAQVRLSRSEFLRRISLGHYLPEASELAGAQAIRDLLSANADQARLGNLLKLTLDEADGRFGPATISRIENLMSEIRDTQASIRTKVEDLHFQIRPNRKRRA